MQLRSPQRQQQQHISYISCKCARHNMKGQRVTKDRMRKTIFFTVLRMLVVNPYQPMRPAQIIRSSAPAGLPCWSSWSAQGRSRQGPSSSRPCSRRETAVACRRRSPDRWQDVCKPASPASRCQTRRSSTCSWLWGNVEQQKTIEQSKTRACATQHYTNNYNQWMLKQSTRPAAPKSCSSSWPCNTASQLHETIVILCWQMPESHHNRNKQNDIYPMSHRCSDKKQTNTTSTATKQSSSIPCLTDVQTNYVWCRYPQTKTKPNQTD